jgi:vacuolar-type H+-ATPase subunit E/Vma4
MSVYEPADSILENAKKRAENITKEANNTVLNIKANSKKDLNQKLTSAKEAIIKEIENKNLSKYSKMKIDYDKALQNALSDKYIEIKEVLIKRLVEDEKYATVLNKVLNEQVQGLENFKVYANLDINLIDKEKSPLNDNSISHGFIIDFGQKVYSFDVDQIVDEFIKKQHIM